jgi:hypothetical protein
MNEISGTIRRNLDHYMSKEVKLRYHKKRPNSETYLDLISMYILSHKDKKTLLAEHMRLPASFAGYTLRDHTTTYVVTE